MAPHMSMQDLMLSYRDLNKCHGADSSGVRADNNNGNGGAATSNSASPHLSIVQSCVLVWSKDNAGGSDPIELGSWHGTNASEAVCHI